MNLISFEPLFHRGAERIAIRFLPDTTLRNALREVGEVKWSQTHRCWYIAMDEQLCHKAITALKPLGRVDTSSLKNYLDERKKKEKKTPSPAILLPAVTGNEPEPAKAATSVARIVYPVSYKSKGIRSANAHVLPAMEQHLKLKAYSASTIRTYLGEMAQLLYLLNDIPADDLKPEHMKRYLTFCYESLGLKENSLHSRTNALKFYYEQVLHREKFFWDIPRPKKQIILPKVLSDVEIGRMFRALSNTKHKAILFTAYSAGLRVSEVVKLKVKDIDTARMTLFIENAKGKKDRVVNLSPILLDILRGYLKQAKPKPRIYIFEGEVAGEPMSIRNAQNIFLEAKRNAGISKTVSFHSLRHSFATHLLEKGVDIRYIKDILGHFNIKTTERYTHVSRRSLVNIISPLDDLAARGIL